MSAPCQRWRDRRDSYRPDGETIRTREYEVHESHSDSEARAFVEAHHYSGSYPAARLRFFLRHRDELVGVAVLSQPASQAALEKALPFAEERAELGRFVLLDSVPANGESWFIARAFELARARGLEAVVAHSDPVARRTSGGAVVFPGHIGTIYQATNARYLGFTGPQTLRLFSDGSVLSARALSKLRARDKGYRYVVELLVGAGAPAPVGDWRTWTRAAVGAVTRPLRHRGNHRYVWALDRALRKKLPESLPYPKLGRSAS